MPPTASLDTRFYRAAPYLYPPAFRREFSGEIVRVFNEARHETQVASPAGGLWAFRARMIADLASAVVDQWLRTGWPFIVVISMLYPLMAASALARLWRRTPFVLPRGTSDADAIVLALLAAIVLVVIATTIILTLWFTRPLLYRRLHRRRP
jgi:hypothetical protein